ncbi:MAG: T9SS type A sorting domain-containing protein [Bacteroidota bacterium]
MKTISKLLFFCFLLAGSTLSAQEVVRSRTANLTPLDYSITGQAILEEYDDGSLTLRLSSDYTTPRGPDVRLFLANSASVDGAVEIADLSAGAGHFSGVGPGPYPVPANITLEQFDQVFFYCLAFRLPWAEGDFGPPVTVGGGDTFECLPSTTSATDGSFFMNVCPEDDVADIIQFTNDLSEAAGDHYAYLITDENEVLQEVVLTNTYDFEGSTTATQRVYGLHYDGTLSTAIGANRLQTTASECFMHSDTNTFLTITKNACQTAYECSDNATATTDWVTSVDICPTDGTADSIELRNNLSIAPGAHYAYLITDTNEVVQRVVFDSIYNFEGSGLEEQRVYGINYDGQLSAIIGANRMQTSATGCLTHSSADLFLAVTKNACPAVFACQESLTATHNWVTDVALCATDGQEDALFLQNNIDTPPGEHYAFLLTDTNEVLQEIILDTVYNFEGKGTEPQRVYGLSYSGTLMPAIGEVRANTTATDCYIHSGDLYISVNKTAACATSTFDAALSARIKTFPNPTGDLLNLQIPESFQPEVFTLFTLTGQPVLERTGVSAAPQLQLDLGPFPAGHYTLRLTDGERVAVKRVVVVR